MSYNKLSNLLAERDHAFRAFFEKRMIWSNLTNELRKMYPQITEDDIMALEEEIRNRVNEYRENIKE